MSLFGFEMDEEYENINMPTQTPVNVSTGGSRTDTIQTTPATRSPAGVIHEYTSTDEEKETDISLLPSIAENPLDQIASTALVLGVLFGISSTTLIFTTFKAPSIYIMSLSLFHFLEFYVTAKYNPRKVHKESFIINNGNAYTIAHSFALLESFIEYYFFPSFKLSFPYIRAFGLILIVFGQFIRYTAMKTAGKSFSHLVVTKRDNEHELVTSGIYAYSRHPSYFGFFWWAIGTQLLLLNPLALFGFAIVLRSFFNERIRYEEKYLISFFGDRYVEYRAKTPIYIPFVG